MKLFTLEAPDINYRRHVFPLLKPFWKGEGFTDDARKKLYEISENDVGFTDSLVAADWAVLPMSWNHYVANRETEKAKRLIATAYKAGKRTLSFTIGDFGVVIPHAPGLLVFRPNGERSKLPENHVGIPPFIEDPLKKYYQTTEVILHPYAPEPAVGFCGHANNSLWKIIGECSTNLFRKLLFHAGLRKELPQPLYSATALRASLLHTLQDYPGVRTNFIFRNQYRAGAVTEEERSRTTREFYENMRDSDYIVCVRGAGNFSIRFYEALAMGRIPVFLNTDCLLPLDHITDWKKHVVWVEYKDRHLIGEKVADFHSSLSSATFENLQLANRRLWEEKLTLKGFFDHFLNAYR